MDINQFNCNEATIEKSDIYPFLHNGIIEDLIVFTFSKNVNNVNQKEYIVIGKIPSELLNDDNKRTEIRCWLSQFSDLINGYKSNADVRKQKLVHFDFVKICNKNLLTNAIEFTQEGYDLLTGKNVYSDGIIEKTVDCSSALKGHHNDYNNINDQNKVVPGGLFHPMARYIDDYYFNFSELNRLSPNQLLGYLDKHKYKLDRLFLKQNWKLEQYKPGEEAKIAILTALEVENDEKTETRGKAM